MDDDEIGDDQFMELRSAETFVTKHTQPAHVQTEGSQGHHSGSQPVTVVVSSPVLEDSSSDKAILDKDYHKGA